MGIAPRADSDLRQRYLFALRDLTHGFDESDVLGEVFGLETGEHAAEVVGREVREGAQGAGEEAAGDGAVGCDWDLDYFVKKGGRWRKLAFFGLQMEPRG